MLEWDGEPGSFWLKSALLECFLTGSARWGKVAGLGALVTRCECVRLSGACLLLFLPSGNEISRLSVSPADSEQVKEGRGARQVLGPLVRLIPRSFFPGRILGGHLPRVPEWGACFGAPAPFPQL